ncbi:MAG: cation:proton antiporter subunit C [Syntrophorhabdaceae bacterium]|nr:cation:proton antiporter subunit C [Syntrophorhabdaceae bacterium]
MMMDFILAKFNYWVYVVLIMIGFYGMMTKKNLMKKLIGMNIFQWSIILFYISIGSKKNATLPIIMDIHSHAPSAADYINPLPHVLMLTAIVVGVATTGIALTLLVLIYKRYGTIEEDEVIEALKK